jgi:predicted phosphodiesterase
MRYGVAGDVHGNLHALRAVLDALRLARVERIVCPGDVVGYGPRPDDCVELLAGADALVAAGNHDLMATGRLPVDRTRGLVRETIEWTSRSISDATRSWLDELPLELRTDDGLLVTHGGIGDPTRYVRDRPAALEQLARLELHDASARGLLLGHTHHPAIHSARDEPVAAGRVQLRSESGPWLLNAGSVGQSRERRPLARALVVDLDRGYAEFLALTYDVRATRRELRERGLPAYACHVAPGRLAALRRRLSSARRRSTSA